jgi:F-type H+-transporting ATPase subunit b
MITLMMLAEEPSVVDIDLYSALWVLTIFLILAIVLYLKAWPNVLAGLKAREERIRKDIADAEAARIGAQKAQAELASQLADGQKKVQAIIDQATVDAEKVATSIKVKAQQEAEESKDRALKEIENAKNLALREVYDQMADYATSIAEKIIRKNLKAEDQRDLVARSLEELQSVGKN